MPNMDEQLLKQMSDEIEARLKSKRLNSVERRALQMDRLMVAFMTQYIDDHKKVMKHEDAYNLGKWAIGILGAANLLYLFNMLLHV